MTKERISYCRICEALCGIVVSVDGDRVTKIRGDVNHPVSRGYLCPKGASMAKVQRDSDRVTGPLRRVGGPGEFEPTTWDRALGEIAERLSSIVTAHGPDALAVYLGQPAAFSTSLAFGVKQFCDTVGTRNLFTSSSQDTHSRSAASHYLYGTPFAFPIPDIPHTDLLMIVGANPLVSHGSVLTLPRIRDELAAVVKRGGRVVVVDPARTATADAFEWLPIRPGTDAWLISAMLCHLFASERVKRTAVAELALGLDALEAAVSTCTPERAAERCGIPAPAIRELAEDFASARSAVAYSRVGLCRSPFSTLAVYLLDALNVATGNYDRRGGWVWGASPVDLPAIMERAGLAGLGLRRGRVGGLPDVGGRQAWTLPQEITTPGRGQVRAFFSVAGNPVQSTPDGAALEAALARLELIVSFDFYVTDTSRFAHYLLPPPTFLERADVTLMLSGHMPRPWIHATPAVVPPPAEVREEWQILGDLATRMGIAPERKNTPRAAMDEMLRASEIGDRFGEKADGWSLDRLEAVGRAVVLADAVPVGVSKARVRRPGGMVDLGARPVLGRLADLLAMPPDSGLALIGRRDLRSLNSWFHNVRPLRSREADGPRLYVHPDDARHLGIAEGDAVRVRSSAGTIEVGACVTESVRRGVVCYPHGWGHRGGWRNAVALGGANVNRLAPNGIGTKDPLSGASWLDGIPVTLEKI